MGQSATVRERIVGSWKLKSFQFNDANGGVVFPLGEDALGYMIYTQEGYMASQLMAANRTPYRDANPSRPTEEEAVASITSYFSYAGKFDVDAATGLLTHKIDVSLYPNWTGECQPRRVIFRGEDLELGSTTPVSLYGSEVTTTIIWTRC